MVAVPEEHKDEKYWEKRLKNKEATRRSREAKRLKENQIVLRAAYLEKENKVLKQVGLHILYDICGKYFYMIIFEGIGHYKF